MIDKIDRDTAADNNIVGQRKLSYGEFEHVRLMTLDQYDIKGILFGFYLQLCCELKSKEVSQSFKRVVTKKDNIQTHGGMSLASAVGKCLRFLISC